KTPPASPALPARGGMAAQRNAAGVPCPLAAHRGKRRVAQRSRRRQPLGVDARPAFRRWWTAPLLPTNGSAPAPSKRLRGRGGANAVCRCSEEHRETDAELTRRVVEPEVQTRRVDHAGHVRHVRDVRDEAFETDVALGPRVADARVEA